jgi:hypothetical protein
VSKPKLQARLAALSFTEKIKILEKLRDREKAIAAAGLRKKNTVEQRKNDRSSPGSLKHTT